MTTQELLFRNFKTAVDLIDSQTSQTDMRKIADLNVLFGVLLDDRLHKLNAKTNPESTFVDKGCYTIQNEGGSYASFIYTMTSGDEPGKFYQNPDESKTVTVLLHWGLKISFLTDLESWGPKYIIEDVPYAAIEAFEKEGENNYWSLSDAFTAFKDTNKWEITIEEEC